jgi:hypothetical protein
MKAESSGNNTLPFIPRLAIASIVGALTIIVLGFTAAPDLRGAEPPADQIKAAGAIPLTTELMDKMDKFIAAVTADDAAKTEMSTVGKDPTMIPETWAAAIKEKCPKTSAHFASAGITAEEFFKAINAMMACLMSEDMAKSENTTAKANAEFLKANNARAEKTFGGFISLGEPGAKP